MIVTSSSSDYLHTTEKNICVYDVNPYTGQNGWCYISRNDGLSYCDKLLNYSDLIDGYELVGSNCVMKNDLHLTGLTQNQWNYLLSLLAHFIGFTLLFLTNLTVIYVVKK